jgi:hypothetical protein
MVHTERAPPADGESQANSSITLAAARHPRRVM